MDSHTQYKFCVCLLVLASVKNCAFLIFAIPNITVCSEFFLLHTVYIPNSYSNMLYVVGNIYVKHFPII